MTKAVFYFIHFINTRQLNNKRFNKDCSNWMQINAKNNHEIYFLFLQHLDIVSPFQLYFNPTLIVLHYQVWRLVTTFLFFGTIGFNFLFNMTFTYRYCRMLEDGSFRGKSADFIMMFLFGGTLMIVSHVFVETN